MKKRLLLLSMVSGLALVGCDVSQLTDDAGNQIIVKLGDSTVYTADDLFENYSHTSAGASQYFNAVYDVLIRAVQPITSAIENSVSKDMNDFVQSAKEAASTNGTSYKTELSKSLENEGVESLDELEQVYYLKRQKEAYEESYYETGNGNLESLLKEYIQYYAPYHVRHILVKTSSGDSLYKGTISKDDAESLADTVARLASGRESFGSIALTNSDDTGSAELYGDLGIMDINTSFVSEFKYSLYQYDQFFNSSATEAVEAYDARQTAEETGTYVARNNAELIPVSDEEQTFLEGTLNRIPYSVFTNLKKYSNVTTDPNGDSYKEGKEEYFPRNILFNKYLNEHSVGVIVRGEDASVQTSTRFQHIEGVSATNAKTDDVLVDETGRPILVTRAGTGSSGDSEESSGYQGIHFIIAQKSPFATTGDQTQEQLLESLEKYYDMTVRSPSDPDFDPNSFVTYLNSTNSTYEERAEKIKTNVKGFDQYMNFRLYEQALSDATEKYGSVEFGNVVEETTEGAQDSINVQTLIDRYISSSRSASEYSAKETYETSWESYVRLLKLQNQLEGLEIAESEIKNFDSSFTEIK